VRPFFRNAADSLVVLAIRGTQTDIPPTSIGWRLEEAVGFVAGERTTTVLRCKFPLSLHRSEGLSGLQAGQSAARHLEEHLTIVGSVDGSRRSKSVDTVRAHLQPSTLAPDQRLMEVRVGGFAQELEVSGAHRLVGCLQCGGRT